MATEAWTLDGVALASGNFTLLELDAPPPRERPDWITAADSENGALMRQPLHENRVITMKIRVAAQASMDAALDQVAAVVTKLRKASESPDGIALVWVPSNSARSRTFDVLEGEITELPIAMDGQGASWTKYSRPVFSIELTCKPYWRGTETLTSTASSSTPFVTLEIPSVTGDAPALGRLIVTDTATQSRRHVEWGLEGPLTYNSGLSLLVDSDNFVTSGFAATQTTATGAYDPNAAGNQCVTVSLVGTPVTSVCGTGNLSHVGAFRVKARVQSSLGSTTKIRLNWQAGDGPRNYNPWVSPVAAARWEEIDLGVIEVPVATLGTQRWEGEIEAYDVAACTLLVDYMILVPVSNGYGKALALYSPPNSSFGVNTGHDEFTGTTSGSNLNARVAPAGGTWATSGDATDYTFTDDTWANRTEPLKRNTAVANTLGRFAILGTATPTDVLVQAAIRNTAPVPEIADGTRIETGVIARWTDANNYLWGQFVRAKAAGVVDYRRSLEIWQRVASVNTMLGSVFVPPSNGAASATWKLIRMAVSATGQVVLLLLSDPAGATLGATSGFSTALATGGALANGKSGLKDFTSSTSSIDRYYDDFWVSTPPAESIVIYSGQDMQVRYDATLREDSTGTYYGRPQSYRGSRFLVPVGTSRVLVKARRNNIEALADDNVTDATQIQVGWTQRGIAVPR